MTHRRGSFVRGRGISDSQWRKKLWGAFVLSASPAGVTTPTIRLVPSMTGGASPTEAVASVVFATQPEATMLRIRGSLNLEKNDVTAIEIKTLAFGIGVMETGALNLGSAPNPASPDGSDWDGWMFTRSINTSILDANAAIVDVKSMRKIQSGYSLFFAAGVYSMTTDDSVTTNLSPAFEFTARGLLLLP